MSDSRKIRWNQSEVKKGFSNTVVFFLQGRNLKDSLMLKEHSGHQFWKLTYINFSGRKHSSRFYYIFTVVFAGQHPVRWSNGTLSRQGTHRQVSAPGIRAFSSCIVRNCSAGLWSQCLHLVFFFSFPSLKLIWFFIILFPSSSSHSPAHICTCIYTDIWVVFIFVLFRVCLL